MTFEKAGPRLNSRAHIAQLVEHFLGKEEVTGSNPVMGSIYIFVAGHLGAASRTHVIF